MKGIILAGGSGTRLYPLTKVTSKQLLPIYDKPMIYYPLSTLMLAGINEILIISTPDDLPKFEALLGDGHHLGLKLSYKQQEKPEGLTQAFIIGEKFIGDSSVCLVLGDNIFYGNGFSQMLYDASKVKDSAIIFGQFVKDPERYGVIELDENWNVLSLEEKPKSPKSNFASVGLYFYDNKVIEYAKSLKKSKRGEYEITDLNNIYLKSNKLKVKLFGRGFAWLDTGTVDSLFEASNFMKSVENIQGIKIAVLEEIAFNNGWISKEDLKMAVDSYGKSSYGDYLRCFVKTI